MLYLNGAIWGGVYDMICDGYRWSLPTPPPKLKRVKMNMIAMIIVIIMDSHQYMAHHLVAVAATGHKQDQTPPL